MNENKEIETLKNTIRFYEDLISDLESCTDILHKTIQELFDYDSSYEVTVANALRGRNAIGGGTNEENFSARWVDDYSRIMWLTRIALNYSFETSDIAQKMYNR